MKTLIEKVDISITTKRNTLPTSKPVAGKFRLGANLDKASFVEEEDAKVIYGEPKSKRVMRGNKCAVYWHSEKEEFIIRVRVKPDPLYIMEGEWSCEDCINYIRRSVYEKPNQ